MKKFILVFIVFCFSYIGYLVKQKFKTQRKFLEQLKDFLEYFKSNVTVLKNDVVEIIHSYKMIQKNKNAKDFDLFQNNENLFKFSAKTLKKNIFNENTVIVIENYFNDFGSKPHEFEMEKLDNILKFIDCSIQKTDEEIKSKGDIWFKILIAFGLVFAIVLW